MCCLCVDELHHLVMIRYCGLGVTGSSHVCGSSVFLFQAEDGIRDLVRSRGLGDVYKRQKETRPASARSFLAAA